MSQFLGLSTSSLISETVTGCVSFFEAFPKQRQSSAEALAALVAQVGADATGALSELVKFSTNNSTALLWAIIKGAGIGWSPTYIHVMGPKMVPLDIGAIFPFDIWLTYHPDAARVPRVRRMIDRRPALKATSEAVGDGDWRLLILMRLSPFVPFNAQNYALGITDVGLGAFLVSTVVGMLPGTVLCIYLGVIGRAAGQDSPEHWLSLGLGLVATVAAIVLTRRRVRAKLKARGAYAGA